MSGNRRKNGRTNAIAAITQILRSCLKSRFKQFPSRTRPPLSQMFENRCWELAVEIVRQRPVPDGPSPGVWGVFPPVRHVFALQTFSVRLSLEQELQRKLHNSRRISCKRPAKRA